MRDKKVFGLTLTKGNKESTNKVLFSGRFIGEDELGELLSVTMLGPTIMDRV
jgi:hypothetical protein